jgi:hypothetical protein
MFDDQVVAEGGAADEVGSSAQLYDLDPHGGLQESFLAPGFSEGSGPASNGEPPAGGLPPSARDEPFLRDEEDEGEDLDEGGKEEEEDTAHLLPKGPLHDEMPERNLQDQKLVPFVAKVVARVSKMMHRLLMGRQPTKTQILALSKYMQGGDGASPACRLERPVAGRARA